MKLIIALAAVLTSAALTVPTVSGAEEVAVAYVGDREPTLA
jgi:hypothetical protein